MAAKKSKKTKHTIKFLAGCTDRNLIRHILRKADKQVVKGICNAAFNVTKGEVPLKRNQKRFFSKHRKIIGHLTSQGKSLDQQHRSFQKGGAIGAVLAAVVPPILSAVLSAVGSNLFNH